ncbi:MAG: hypothetical protein JO270_06950 [Acidobacteriaceae bacterium]|nr:hypothetical protein [Acidobacteriaceae bacterium]MBV8571226.1 hypothetical protein [Acidobacteriaceae bacterium]
MPDAAVLTGSVRALLLFEIAEEIDLTHLHRMLGTSPSKREPAFRHPAPEYVRYERVPVVDTVGQTFRYNGQAVSARIRYFNYGVASVEFQMNFHKSWSELIRLANQWVSSPELEGRASALLQERLGLVRDALKKSNEGWISEDYYVLQVDPIVQNGSTLTADELLRTHGSDIAQLVRGEDAPLSPAEQQEILRSTMSYYPTDLLVVAWVAAFVYDSEYGASPTIDLLEYANTQLLEFRYYDEVLTGVLGDVYKRLETTRNIWAQWRLARHAEELNTIRLDYRELAERTDNAIKFISDMFYARAYRLAAARIGVSDYRNLVTEKLTTARDLYDSMVNEFHQSRAFVLELMVVIILVIEIVFLFRGKG